MTSPTDFGLQFGPLSRLSGKRFCLLTFVLAALLLLNVNEVGHIHAQELVSPDETPSADAADMESNAVQPLSDEAPKNAESVNVDAEPLRQAEQGTAGQEDTGSADSTNPAETQRTVPTWRPLAALILGVAIVLFLMIGLKTHAFLALILGALAISCFVPLDVIGFVKNPEPSVVLAETGSPVNIIKRVTDSLGGAVSSIGILIAMAAIIGKCMLVSGAADRIVKSTLAVFGEKRAALAMMFSGFILSVPVFFDTVFYLLVPLARSLYRSTGRNYLLYLGAIAAGGAVTHTLVPPTPGPLLVATALEVKLGNVILIGVVVGIPTAICGLIAAMWLNRIMPIAMRPQAGSGNETIEEQDFETLPPLGLSLVPVLLPVAMIAIFTVYKALPASAPEKKTAQQMAEVKTNSDNANDDGINNADSASEAGDGSKTPAEANDKIGPWIAFIGNANIAMTLAAIFSIFLCWQFQNHTLQQLAEHVEDALLSGGVIILITAAGGAFGGLLGMTEIQVVVKSLFENREGSGIFVIVLAFGLAAILKVAQGSSTVSMIISSSLVASIAMPLVREETLGFDAAYLVPAIGAGSLMGSWMNDSGFWVFAKMGVLTETETLKSWTVILSVLSLIGLITTLAMVSIIPFPFGEG